MLYVYACNGCRLEWEVNKRLADIDRPEPCPNCDCGDTHRLPQASGFTTSESLGRVKAPSDFRDFVRKIHKDTPGSKIEVE